jgi:hypothetical protein
VSPSMRAGRPPGSRRGRQIAAIAAAALVAVGCTAGGSVPAAPASRAPGTGSGASPALSPSRAVTARGGFTVSGSVPVESNPSQDTHARDPAAACQRQKLRRDEALGQATVAAFTSARVPVSAMLLAHFLGGTGTAVHFGAGSQISQEARASSVFRSLNRQIQAAILSQLRAGASHVRLAGSPLRAIRFGVPASAQDPAQDLYLGFRGTQGLDVSGRGTMTGRRYTGTLTYVIRDSYGFPPRDQLLGIGTAMRYLQVNCGNPAGRGGARWFPDSMTVTVPFRHPKG